MKATTTFLNRKRAQQLSALRMGLIGQLYPTTSSSTIVMRSDSAGQSNSNNELLLLGDLVSSFKRFASNQQTAFDNHSNGHSTAHSSKSSSQPSATTVAKQLSQQVNGAITQVLRRAPGRISDDFGKALDAAFTKPTNNTQLVALLNASPAGALTIKPDPVLAELSTRQQGLYRQVSVIATDSLKLLDELHTFLPDADNDRFFALQSLVKTQITAFTEEVGRPDEPRAARAISLLRALQESLNDLGEQGKLNNPMFAATLDDDDQIAKFDVLTNYAKLMAQSWSEYYNTEKSGRSYSISERADRARVLLPILSQANQDFGNALESVGVTESERRSRAYRFTTLESSTLTLQQPRISIGQDSSNSQQQSENNIAVWLADITVSDLQDWLHRYSNMEAPNALTSIYGIDFVTDQADRLFWTIAPVIAYLRTTKPLNPAGQSALAQILSNERVSNALDNLLSQLNALADLAI